MNDTNTLTENTRVKLPIGLWLALIVTIAGAFSSFAVAQFQLAAHERRIERLENDRELLLRIDERTAEIKRQLERLTK